MIYTTSGDRNSIYSHPSNRANFTFLKWGEPRIIFKSRWLMKTNLSVASQIFIPNVHSKEELCRVSSGKTQWSGLLAKTLHRGLAGQSLVGALPCEVLLHFHCL